MNDKKPNENVDVPKRPLNQNGTGNTAFINNEYIPVEKKEETKPVEMKVEMKEETKPVEKKEETKQEEIKETYAEQRIREIKERKEVWVTLADKKQNYYNSAEEKKFFLVKGQCKKLPDELTPILQQALYSDVPLLKIADENELKLFFNEEEYEINVRKGIIKPKTIKEEAFKY